MTIIKKFNPEESTKKFSKKYAFLISFSLLILIIIEIWTNNIMVSHGEKLEDLSKLQQALTLENQLLENEIARFSSLNNIASESAILGFSKVESIQYIR